MEPPLVTIEQGTLQGSIGKNLRGDSFYKFQGIPFAKPPIGDLRFKAPVAPDKWDGVFDATKEGDESKQRDPWKQLQASGSENCLTLNIFTKKLPDGQNKNLCPVMVWIHGGGFVSGSSKEEWYGPEFLLTEDIVLVTINYRLGFLGFLSFDDPSLDIPGNAGFKDQVMALKWVQKNITSFGGDPRNVTIFGESAGGVSVHLHLLSPLSKGLFHKAIAQSGSALHPWTIPKGVSKELAEALNLEGASEKVLYQELQKKSDDEILEIQDKLNDNPDGVNVQRLFLGLSIETNEKEAFMVEEPLKAIQSGRFNQVPFMIGYNSCEALIFNLQQENVIDFEKCVPWNFEYSPSEAKEVANKIKKFYFGDLPSTLSKKNDLMCDLHFIYSAQSAVLNQYSKAPTYLYRFSAETELNIFKKLLNLTQPGVPHLDDTCYLFKTSKTPDVQPGSVEDICLTRMVKLWTNFAKCGNPTPDATLGVVWKPVRGANLDFLDIGEELVAGERPEWERIAFWNKLYAESPAGRKSVYQHLKRSSPK